MRKQPLCFNFTKNNLLKIEPPREKRTLYKDTKEKGLVLIVSYGGSKTFYLAQMVEVKYKRLKLGRFPDLPVEEARLKAVKLKYQIAMGEYSTNKTYSSIKNVKKNFKTNLKASVAKPAEYLQLKLGETEIEKKSLPFHNKAFSLQVYKKLKKLSDDFSDKKDFAAGKKLADSINTSIEEELLEIKIHKPKKKTDKRYLTYEELSIFLNTLKKTATSQVQDLFLLLIHTSEKLTTLLSMAWGDIDLQNKIWNISNIKKEKSRSLSLTDEAIQILYRRKQKSNSLWVFPAKNKINHMVKPTPTLRRVVKETGYKGLTFNNLSKTLEKLTDPLRASIKL